MAKIKPVFFTTFFEQKETLETLTDESRADTDFYVFLGSATIITALGLILDSSVIVIGGMLVAPLLFPILALGMGVATSSKEAIKRALITLWRSIALVVVIAFFIGFLLNVEDVTDVIRLASQTTISHFIVALVSGIIASFAWVRRNVNASLPGIAISVSLLPPLAAFGIGISMLEKTVMSGSLFLFIINLLGVTFAAVVVFALFGFSGLQRVQETVIKEEAEMEEIKKHIKTTREEKEKAEAQGI